MKISTLNRRFKLVDKVKVTDEEKRILKTEIVYNELFCIVEGLYMTLARKGTKTDSELLMIDILLEIMDDYESNNGSFGSRGLLFHLLYEHDIVLF